MEYQHMDIILSLSQIKKSCLTFTPYGYTNFNIIEGQKTKLVCNHEICKKETTILFGTSWKGIVGSWFGTEGVLE